MIRVLAFALGLGLLAACGADGPPTPPAEKIAEKSAEKSAGISISGAFAVGMASDGGK